MAILATAPTTAAPLLAKHLGESTCREAYGECKLEVVSLRLGNIISDTDGATGEQAAMALDSRDAVQAVELALAKELLRRWLALRYKSSPERFPIFTPVAGWSSSPQHIQRRRNVMGGGQ
ncbi:MAG: hypothetical protein R2867_30360 [Caldilineaceae bacterium]